VFTLDEKIALVELLDKMIIIEEANLRNLRTIKFQVRRQAEKVDKKLRNLRSARAKLESIK
jgi:hypothetical protein